MVTIGDCVDADLSGELGTWSGVGPALAHWIRETLLAMGRAEEAKALVVSAGAEAGIERSGDAAAPERAPIGS